MQYIRKITAVVLTALMMLSLTSCVFETRDTYDIDESGEHVVTYNEGEEPTMTVAEKTNSVDVKDDTNPLSDIIGSQVVPPEEKEPETVIKVALTGDILIDSEIVADAAKAAADDEEKNYSFLRMFTGAMRIISDSDLSAGAFSSINTLSSPAPDYDDGWTPDETVEETVEKTPVEAVDAVVSLGYDVIDTTGAGDCSEVLKDREVEEISSSFEGDNGIKTVEVSGVTFGFISVGGPDSSQLYDSEEFSETMEYADLISDILIAFVHWDPEDGTEEKAAAARKIAECGADIVIGNGDALGNVEWIETDDGTSTLVAYSLGNLLSSADEGYRLCSGILTFSVCVMDDVLEITDTLLVPEFVFYTEQKDGFQIYRMEDCNSEVTAAHGAEVSVDGLKDFVMSRVDSEFLSEKFSDKVSNR